MAIGSIRSSSSPVFHLKLKCVRLEVFTVMKIQVMIFWLVMCSDLVGYIAT